MTEISSLELSNGIYIVNSVPSFDSQYDEDLDESIISTCSRGSGIVHIPVLGGLKRLSCEFTTTNVPCINKISSHLEHLQRAVEGLEKASHISRNVPNYDGFNRMEAIIGPTPGSEESKAFTTQSMGMEVIDEVTDLIDRMKTDRQQTIDALMRERERIKLLQSQVDKIERMRHHMLRRAVQFEHEACSQDMAELKWMLEFELHQRDEVIPRVVEARKKSKQLQEEIAKLTEECPGIKNKIEVDKLTKNEIVAKLQEAQAAFRYTDGIYKKTYAKYERALSKANGERQQMKTDLDNTTKTLEKLHSDVQEEIRRKSRHEVENVQKKQAIVMENEASKDLDEKMEVVTGEFEDLSERVNDAKIRLLETAESIKAYRRANQRAKNELNTKQEIIEREETQRTKMIQFRKTMMKECLQLTIQMEREIVEFKRELMVAIKKAREDEKATIRAEAELKRLDEQLRVVVEEVEKLQKTNNESFIENERLDEQIYNTETTLKNNLAIFKKSLTDVTRTKGVMEKKIVTERKEFGHFKVESAKKLEKLTTKKDEIEGIHGKLERRADSLKSKLNIIQKAKSELMEQSNERRATLATFKKRASVELEKKKTEIFRIDSEKKRVSKETEDMHWRTQMLKKKLAESKDAIRIVTKLRKQAEIDMEEMSVVNSDLEIECESETETDNRVRENIRNLGDIIKESKDEHETGLMKRNSYLDKLKVDLEKELFTNQGLSRAFKEAQDKQILSKRAYQKSLTVKLALEDQLVEVAKFMELQKQMRAALVSYYTSRGSHNREVLHNFAKGSMACLENFDKVHRDMNDLIEDTEGYLDRFSSGVAPKQPRLDSVDVSEVLQTHDLRRIPLFTESFNVSTLPNISNPVTLPTISEKQDTVQDIEMDPDLFTLPPLSAGSAGAADIFSSNESKGARKLTKQVVSFDKTTS